MLVKFSIATPARAPMVRTMYFEAIKWALGLVPGAAAPIPKP